MKIGLEHKALVLLLFSFRSVGRHEGKKSDAIRALVKY